MFRVYIYDGCYMECIIYVFNSNFKLEKKKNLTVHTTFIVK